MIRARRKLRRFIASIWFFPASMTLGAIGLFILTSVVDAQIAISGVSQGDVLGFLVFSGSPSAARSILSSIATAWATILGVVFSITLVTVQLTATKYTTQVLSEFEKDRINQLVLGAFVGVVVYSLLTLKTVRTDEGGQTPFTPIIGVNLAVLFAIITLLLLILFVENLISFIRPRRFIESIVKAASSSVPAVLAPRQRDWLRVLPPSHDGHSGDIGGTFSERSLRPNGREERLTSWEVRSDRDGFVSGLSWDDLLDVLRSRMRDWLRAHAPKGKGDGIQWRLRIEKHLGDPVSEGTLLAVVEATLTRTELRALGEWVRESFQIEENRRPEEDPGYGLVILGNMGEKACAADADTQLAIECVNGLFSIVPRIIDLPEPANRLLAAVDGGSILIERPTTNLFETWVASLARVVDAAVDRQLGSVPHEMGIRAVDLMLQEARSGQLEDVAKILSAVLPLYQRSFTHLEEPRFTAPMANSLAQLASTLFAEKREAEAQLILAALGKLQRSAKQRPEVADLIREAIRDRTNRKP